MVTSRIPNIGQLVKSPWFLANISRFGGIPFLYLVMLKIPRFGSFRTILVGWSRQIWDGRAALMSLFRWWIPQNDNFILRVLHCPNLRSTYFVCAPESLRNGRNGEVLSRVADDQGFLMVAQLGSWDLWSTYSYDGYPPAMHPYEALMGNNLK